MVMEFKYYHVVSMVLQHIPIHFYLLYATKIFQQWRLVNTTDSGWVTNSPWICNPLFPISFGTDSNGNHKTGTVVVSGCYERALAHTNGFSSTLATVRTLEVDPSGALKYKAQRFTMFAIGYA
jgi:hypothetical protein